MLLECHIFVCCISMCMSKSMCSRFRLFWQAWASTLSFVQNLKMCFYSLKNVFPIDRTQRDLIDLPLKKPRIESNLLFFPHVQWISWISQGAFSAYRFMSWAPVCDAASFYIAKIRPAVGCPKGQRSSFGGK